MQLRIKYGLQTFKLFLIIINSTYFLAVLWYNYCELIEHNFEHPEEASFLHVNDLEVNEMEFKEGFIITKSMYYAFTTLSTVGFGDMKPLND